MKIYFDGVEISSDYYAMLTKTGKVYDDTFKIGATISEAYTLKVNASATSTVPSIITIYQGNVLNKTLYVVDFKDENDNFLTLELEDGMTQFNFRYDASPIMTHTKTVGDETINFAYLSEIFDDICTKANISTDISSFYGDDKEISWYDNTYMARDYLSYIAELNGCNFRISADNKLEFCDINGTVVSTINFNEIGKYKIGVQHIITRVYKENGADPWVYGNTDGETYYINPENVFITEEEDVEYIYDIIKDFTYYNMKIDNCPINGLNTGDLIALTDGTFTFKTFAQFDNANFSGNSWFGGIKVEIDGEKKQETKITGEQDRYKRIKQEVDRNANSIRTLVETTGDLERSVEQIQTDTYTKTEIQRIVDGTGVDGVKVSSVESMSGTFDINGMHYEKSGANTKSTINEVGLNVVKTANDEELLFSGYDNDLGKSVVRSENLLIRRYLVIGENSRIQDYETGGGVFLL